MAKPQQPELRRSGKVAALDPDATETDLTAHDRPETKGGTGKVPAEQRPGHHPDEEQDKPDLDAFAARFGIVPEGDEPEDAPRVEDDDDASAVQRRSKVTSLTDAPSRQGTGAKSTTAKSTTTKPAAAKKPETRRTWSPIGLALVGPVTSVIIVRRVVRVLTRRGR